MSTFGHQQIFPNDILLSPSPTNSYEKSEHNGTIFSRLMSFFLQENNNNLSNKKLNLTLEVESRFNELRKEISIRILDSNDPFFIYTYLIDSIEYEKIKASQNLLLSFESFPSKLINLLEKCSNIPSDTDCKSSFILGLKNLSRTNLTLDILELNEFKNFNHLSFIIPSASDEFIRSNFCNLYRKLKSENESLCKSINNLEDEISSISLSKSQELQNFKLDFQNEKKYLEEKLNEIEQDLKSEKAKNFENERSLKSKITKLQLELRNKECLIEKERKDFEQKNLELMDKFNQELMKKNSKIKEMDEKLKQMINEQNYHKNAKEKNSQYLEKKEEELDLVKKDLFKANEIIKKLQNQVKSNHGKLEILNKVTHKQEEIVGIKGETVDKLSNDLKICLQQLKLKDKTIDQMENDMDKLKTKCSQSELQISAHKKIITNLNKQLELLKLERTKNHKLIEENANVDSNCNKSCVQGYEKEKEICVRKSVPSANCAKKNVDFSTQPVSIQQPKKDIQMKNSLFSHIGEENQPLKTVNVRTISTNKQNVIPQSKLFSNRKYIF